MRSEIPHGLLSGTRVLVTGGAQGNGQAIAIGMAQAGAEVLVADLDRDNAVHTLSTIGLPEANAYSLDISDRSEAMALAHRVREAHGPINCLVNNAGILLRGRTDRPNGDEAWDRTLEVNVTGTYNMIRAFLEQLEETQGNVINLGSIQSFVSAPNSAAYTASKGAVIQLTRALAAEFAGRGIRVNGIAPGVMRTPMTVDTLSSDAAREALLRHIPMNRPGEPEELVGPAIFLASRLASYVTGVMLPVDGGYLTV